MAVKITNKKGKTITLLNPAEKAAKAAAELKIGVHGTNDKKIKRDQYGNAIPLTDTQKAWRSGYLAARKDSAACYNAQQDKKSKGKRKNNFPVLY